MSVESRTIRLSLLTLLLLSAGAVQAEERAIKLEWRISPGTGVGPIKLNASPGWDALKELGNTPKLGLYKKAGVRLSRLKPNLAVDLIELFAPFAGKTVKNIGIGSTKEAVEKAYGQGLALKEKEGFKWVYQTEGIGFTFVDNQVTHIGLFQWLPLRFPQSAASQKTATIKLLPGTGIKGLIFDINSSGDIIRRFGAAPLIQKGSTRGSGTAYIYSDLGITVFVNAKTQMVQQILVTAPFKGKTEKGLGIGSTVDQVRRSFGEKPMDYIYLRYLDRGVSFLFDKERVMAISILPNVDAG